MARWSTACVIRLHPLTVKDSVVRLDGTISAITVTDAHSPHLFLFAGVVHSVLDDSLDAALDLDRDGGQPFLLLLINITPLGFAVVGIVNTSETRCPPRSIFNE
jgi:hypothetical protein